MKTIIIFSVWISLGISSLYAQVLVSADKTIISDTLFPINQKNNLSSKTVIASGQAEFSSQSGYIRILLSDDYGYDLLIYESSPLFTVNGIDNFSSAAMETVDIPSHLALTKVRIEIKNAQLKNLSVNVSERNLSKAQQQATTDRIALINNNLRTRNALWVAGETPVSRMTYEEKKGLFGGQVPDLQGLEYYTGGVFELYSDSSVTPTQNIQSTTKSSYVSSFDWRNRHGINWNTPVKTQFGGTCATFSTVAATEALVNLYYNKKLDMDLSEGDIVACQNTNGCNGREPYQILDYIASTGVVNQECFLNGNCNAVCSYKCPNPAERIKINGYIPFGFSSTDPEWDYPPTEESLKKMLIKHGPLSSGISNLHHAMTLTGFGTIKAGDIIYEGFDNSIVVPINDPRIGTTYWIFKNSYGADWGMNGYGYFKTNIINIGLGNTDALLSPITSLRYTNADIICEDRDGDGYYYWGIGPKPAHCPACAPDEPDGDDSNPYQGPMDQYGYCRSISPMFDVISTSQTWSSSRTLCRNIVIQSGVTLTITAPATVFLTNHTITIKNGGKLVLTGGTIDNGTIVAQSGSELTIINNGKLLLGSYSNLDVQLGAVFNLTYGDISLK